MKELLIALILCGHLPLRINVMVPPIASSQIKHTVHIRILKEAKCTFKKRTDFFSYYLVVLEI